jgi:hypothetical protein
LLTPAYENLPTKTYSSPNAFPSALKSKRALVQNTRTDEEASKGRDPIVGIGWGVGVGGDGRGAGEKRGRGARGARGWMKGIEWMTLELKM